MIKIIEKEDINLISYLKVKLFEEKAKIVFETGVKQQIENTERLSAKNNLNEDLNKKTKK